VVEARAHPVEIILACSSGGHVLQLLALREAWQEFDHAWVTDDQADTRSLLAGERVTYVYGPTARNVVTLCKNVALAWRVIRKARPRVLLTTGAATAVPFAWVARLHGAKVVYVESLTRIDSPSLSCRLIAPVASRVYVQWPELAHAVPSSRYLGTVLPT
jgi:UDP-N-acetylglucosamine:LPS N-acetylglucosamine transferase